MGYDFSIQNFKDTYLKNGLQRPSKYFVETTFVGDSKEMERLTSNIYQPENVVLPSRSIAFGVEQFHGPPMKVPLGRVFNSTIILTYPISENNMERHFFEQWMDSIVDPVSNMARAIASEGLNTDGAGAGDAPNVKIHTLTSSGEVALTYNVWGAFPVGIFPINMGFGMLNDYSRLQVQLEYREYTIDNMLQGPDEEGNQRRRGTPWPVDNHMTQRRQSGENYFGKPSRQDSWSETYKHKI